MYHSVNCKLLAFPAMAADEIIKLAFVTLDVFTSTSFMGNPLAVIRVPAALRGSLNENQKQKIATEFNLSETVFLHDRRSKDLLEWDIDIFTTTEELPFAGHPTIGAAIHALQQLYGVEKEANVKAVLNTKAGRINVSASLQESHAQRAQIYVKAEIPHNVRVHRSTYLGNKTEPLWSEINDSIRQSELKAPFVSIVKGMTFMLIELDSLEDLAHVETQQDDLKLQTMLDTDGSWNKSFVARYYFKVMGAANDLGTQQIIRTRMLEQDMEDPATGSAASALASYLTLNGRGTRYKILQGVEMGRKSVISVEVELNEDGISCKAVRLAGSAVQIMEGSITI